MKFHGVKTIAEAPDDTSDSATSALDIIPLAVAKDEGQGPAEVAASGAAGGGSAIGVLALAQKLHDEYVAEGQNTRKKLISEGQLRHDALVAEALQKKAEVLEEARSERSMIQKEIEELRTFGLDLRTRLKSYLEGQLIELEKSGADEAG